MGRRGRIGNSGGLGTGRDGRIRRTSTFLTVLDAGDHGSYAALEVDDHTQYLTDALVNVKGDLLVGTANDTITRFAVGTNGTLLVVDSAQTEGVKWA